MFLLALEYRLKSRLDCEEVEIVRKRVGRSVEVQVNGELFRNGEQKIPVLV